MGEFSESSPSRAYKTSDGVSPHPAENSLRLLAVLDKIHLRENEHRRLARNTGAWSSPASTAQLKAIVAGLKAAPGQADPAEIRRVHLDPDDTATPSSFVEAMIKVGETISPEDGSSGALDGPTGELPQITQPAEENALPLPERASGRHTCEAANWHISAGVKVAGFVLVAAGAFAGANHFTNGGVMNVIERVAEVANGGPLPK